MKKYMSLVLAAVLLFTASGCGQKDIKTTDVHAAEPVAAENPKLSQLSEPQPVPRDPDGDDLGPFRYIEASDSFAGGTRSMRKYTYPDGATIEWYRLTNTAEDAVVLEISGKNKGGVRYSRKNHWVTHELCDTQICDGWVFLNTDDAYYMILTPRFYKLLENGAIKAVDTRNGCLSIKANSSGTVDISMPCRTVPAGCVCDYMIMKSDEPIVVFDDAAIRFWMPYDNKGSWRWAFDGYYFESAPTYIPTGENVYTNMPSCYLAAALMKGLETYDAVGKILNCLLHTMTLLQNDEGYVESRAVSTWLSDDYGIDCGYYDTRFNSDLAEKCLAMYDHGGGDFYLDYLGRYMDFYVKMAEETGWQAGEGIFVPDYRAPKEHKTPHTALNHQLAEMSVLYKLAPVLNRPELTELADSMLRAIENTAEKWIMADSNLEYAILPGETFGFTDYPYLTYNDLYDMQALLTGLKGAPSEKLQYLMDKKKIWMDANRVTGYKK